MRKIGYIRVSIEHHPTDWARFGQFYGEWRAKKFTKRISMQ